MPILRYRNESETPCYAYRVGRATTPPDFTFAPMSGGIFPIEGKHILIRGSVDPEKPLNQPDFAFIDWLDGKAAVSCFSLLTGGSEIELEALKLFFRVTHNMTNPRELQEYLR